MLTPWKKSCDEPRQCVKKQRHHFVNRGPSNPSYGFSSSHDVWMWELDYKEGWVPKNWCFQTGVLEKTLESPWDSKEIKPVHPRGNQPWILTGGTDAEAETPVLWPHGTKSQLIGKDHDAGTDWGAGGGWEEKGMTETEMDGWHHQLSGHEFEQTQIDSEGQKSLACCGPWGSKELDTTELLNNNKLMLQEIWECHFPAVLLLGL